MEERLSIEQVLDSKTNEFSKTKPSLIISILLIIIGIATLFFSTRVSDSSTGIISPILILLGILLLVWGVIIIFFRKTYYKSNNNKQKVLFKEVFYDIKERDKLIRLINEKKVDGLKELKPSVHDALKLRVAYTPDANVCFAQVITYVPFEFVNACDAVEYSPEDASVILKELKK